MEENEKRAIIGAYTFSTSYKNMPSMLIIVQCPTWMTLDMDKLGKVVVVKGPKRILYSFTYTHFS